MSASHINTECKRYGCIKNLLACYANCRYSARCDDLRNELIDKTEIAARDINTYLGQRGLPPITVQLQKRGVKFPQAAASQVNLKRRASPSPPGKGRQSRSLAILDSGDSTFERKPSSKALLDKRPNRAKKGAKTRKRKPSLSNLAKNRLSNPVEKPVREAKSASRKTSIRAADGGRKTRSKDKVVMRKKAARSDSASAIEKERSLSDKPSERGAISANASKRKSISARKSKSSSRASSLRSRKGKIFIILEGDTASLVDEQGLMAYLISDPSSEARYFEASEVEARVQIVPKK